MGVGKRELAEGPGRQCAAPGVEDHHGLRARFDLGIQIVGNGPAGDGQYVVQQIRPIVEHGLERAEVVRAATFDHVAGKGERTAGKADQGDGTIERAPNFANGVEHIAQMHGRIRRRQIADRPFLAQRPLEAGAFPFGEVQAEAHGIGDGQNVRKQDGGIERIARQRLQGHLAGKGRVLAEIEKAARPSPRFAVLG